MNRKSEFIPPNNKEIIEILELVNESEFDELSLEIDDIKLIFSKGSIDPSGQSWKTAQPLKRRQTRNNTIAPAESAEVFKPDQAVTSEGDLQKAEVKEATPREEERLIPIKAPLLGIFYRAPKPGAPPFVEIESVVTEDETVCLIEVMKLFNTVKAGVKGRVVKICAENNEMVEYNQTLFLIETEESSEESSNA